MDYVRLNIDIISFLYLFFWPVILSGVDSDVAFNLVLLDEIMNSTN